MKYFLISLIVLRLCWTVLPQNGYIHPDEFFQTVEVVAGDALNISVIRTWEFTSSFPLRSMVLPQLLFSPFLILLKYANETFHFHMTGYHLIICYRLVMTILSLWIDICLYKICKLIGVKEYTGNILLASSYVTLTFQIHTFSNSFETILFVTLFLLVLTCMRKDEYFLIRCDSQAVSRSDNDLAERRLDSVAKEDGNAESNELDSSFDDLHKTAFVLRQRNRKAELKTNREQEVEIKEKESQGYGLDRSSTGTDKLWQKREERTDASEYKEEASLYRYIAAMAATVTAGVFNRPTYIIFATLPLIWWADRCLFGKKSFYKRMSIFILSGIVFSVGFVVMDTVYFSDIEIPSLLSSVGWRKVIKNWVLTPLNFFLYNSKVSNLETHGRHPLYVHLLVNMPLLFGPMLIYMIKATFSYIMAMFSKKRKTVITEKKSSSETNMSMEEKLKSNLKQAVLPFIFFPAVTMSFFPHQEARFLIPLLPLVVISVVIFYGNFGKVFWSTFIAFNISMCVVFGILHQGGIVPCLLKLQHLTETEFKEDNSSVTVIFSHTYMPPKHLLLLKTKNVELMDFQGADLQTVYNEIHKIRHSFYNDLKSSNALYKRRRIFLALPGTLLTKFKLECNRILKVSVKEKFFPHLSFEDPPDIKFIDSFKTFSDMLSLYLIEIE